MKARRVVLDLAFVQNRTYLTNKARQGYIDIAKKLTEDPDSEERREKQECQLCFYNSRIGGAAMTDAECGKCGKLMHFCNTCTDVLCLECAKELELCKHCGADIEGRKRKKL